MHNSRSTLNEGLKRELHNALGYFAQFNSPALQNIDWQIDHELLARVQPHEKLHGKELAHATRYRKTRKRIKRRNKDGSLSKRSSTRPFKVQVEFSLRADGHILRRFTHTHLEEGREWQYGYESVAHFRALDHSLVIKLAEAWIELGYMVTVAKGDWVEAELALSMIAKLGEKS